MQNLKSSFWVSCCIHLGVMAGILFLATSFQQRPVEESSPVIELVSVPAETPPKLIVPPALPSKPVEEKPVVLPPHQEEKAQPPAKPKIANHPAKKEEIKSVAASKPILVPELTSSPEARTTPVAEIAPVEIKPSVEEGSGSASVESSPILTAQPRYRDNPKADYPLTAIRRHQEGTVILLVAVNAIGQADAIDVKESSGFSTLDDAAKSAVSRWKFDPARTGGEPIASKVEVPVRFQLSK